MRKFLLLLCFCGFTQLYAQQKGFWKEDFSSGKLPAGWIVVDSTRAEGQKYEWMVTDQPYPGSFQFDQQAPPIASTSRGYHIQYRAGVFTGEEVTKWNQKKQYPGGYFRTAAIDCRGKNDVILKFQHVFRWNSWFTRRNDAGGRGLWIGVSTDGETWKEYDVLKSNPAATNMFQPLTEEIDISEIAANQPAVYLRFFWKGMFSWYWMIDDIELTEPYQNDLAIEGLVSHRPDGNTFTTTDTLIVKIKNTGVQNIAENFDITAVFTDGVRLKATVDAANHPIKKQEEREIAFPATDLSKRGSHNLTFTADYAKDERLANNRLDIKLNAARIDVGKVTGFTQQAKSTFEFTAGYAKVKVIFYRDDIFRIWLAPDGEYTNPAGNAIVVDYEVKNPSISVSQNAQYYKLESKNCILRVYKDPMRFAMYDKTNKQVIWEEVEPIYFGSQTGQTLKEKENEYFYGGGMQNGRFSHAGKELEIADDGGWNDGAHPNPAPFYMSTAGYGVFRNTFAKGKYTFAGEDSIPRPVSQLVHNENRFDAFYFYGPSLKNILGDYTDITGKPFMPAMWMLTVGDANCYNKPEQRLGWPQSTPDVIRLIADEYIRYDMPRGWILPNDGYGCSYVKLDSTVKELEKRGFKVGLWTENGVDKIAWEVGQAGTRLCKLDVAWVGSGYEFALNGAKSAFEGIENNSNERGFVWTVRGWAGTQRYATVWSGDQSADWNYIRYHIPTVIGSGLSAQNAATSDVDGIFGGSSRTYVRDLQWKCFTPFTMSMSGWADVNKQPWTYGYPYTDINRKFLKLKMRLNPYAYTACHEAYTTGIPMVRGMILEFPDDPVTYGTETQYQFMSGPSMLVAPVYKRGNVRDSIYLPKGQWYDYWTGTEYEGNRWIEKYEAKMDICPVFIRQGAIIPMYPDMNYVWEKPADILTLDLYPSGNTAYELYEDDGITRDYKKGEFAKTLFSVSAPESGSGKISVHIGKARGDFKGRLKERVYLLDVRSGTAPSVVKLNGLTLNKLSMADFEAGKTGWSFDPEDRTGRIKIRTEKVSTDVAQGFEIIL
ncbi:MAG: DUF4968 domain-containing protein [Candidatus Symbiothrix sp.]|jgi:alpha-glucosidase (family GH31 glycosyl hydrolase)|nr:DUF4968 domain-containing protein [Candidatus Symbiothrix sp.]